ncbi:MAG TPA: glycogen-binding domain-containing protein [Longimicrobiales bacterium]|nr:glycogen-binding domain-containing protein [Longimicrobiales bacterium]
MRLALVLALALAAPGAAAAQQWAAEARLGRLDFRLSPTGAPPATSLALALGLAASDLRFHVAAGVPLGEEDPLWGAVDLGNRPSLDVGAFTLGVETAGQAFLQRYTQSVEVPGGPFQPPTLGEEAAYGWGIAAQAVPFLAVRAGAMGAEARAGASFYRSALDERSASRTVGLGELRLIAAPTQAVALTAEARHFTAEDGSWTFAGVGTLVALPGVELRGSVGRWFDDAATTTPWSAGAAVRLAERVDLVLEGREDALDPLYGSAPRRSWSAALRVRLTEPPRPAEPVPASYDDGAATIILPAAEGVEAPGIAGDFNGWSPEPMQRQGDRWVWRGRVEPGVYEYAFVDARGAWFVPESVPGRKDDGMGGWVALLVVEEPRP